MPSYFFNESAVVGITDFTGDLEQGGMVIPPPSDDVADGPVISKPVYDIWKLGSENLEVAVIKFERQIKAFIPKLLSSDSGLGIALILFILSIITAGAIGGMILSGIIGLFAGAVVLSITYKVFEAILVKDVYKEDNKINNLDMV